MLFFLIIFIILNVEDVYDIPSKKYIKTKNKLKKNN